MIYKVVIRNIRRTPFLNIIKVLGLSMAFCCLLGILLFVRHELSFDQFHSKADNIYRLTLTHPDFLGGKHLARISNPSYLEDLKSELPGIDNYVRLRPVRGGLVRNKQTLFDVSQGFVVDSTFLSIFDVVLVVGNKVDVLNQPSQMIISETFANKLFGNSNPIGEVITVPTGQHYQSEQRFTINGVMKDFPNNSHLHPDFIVSASDANTEGWAWTYLLINNGHAIAETEEQVVTFLAKRAGVERSNFETNAYLQPIKDIHLYSHKLREIEANGNINSIHLLLAAAFIILFIGISNYANLNRGMQQYRSKYLFVSKIMGSTQTINMRYVWMESIMVISLSLLVSVVLFYGLTYFSSRYYSLNLFSGNQLFVCLFVVASWGLGVVFSLIPSIISLLPKVFRGASLPFGNLSDITGKMLTIGQYSFTIVLIIAVFVILKQTVFALDKGMGSEQNNVFIIESVHADVQKDFELFKQELSKYNSIEFVSAMMEPPGGEANDMFPFEMEGFTQQAENEERIGVFPCDYSFTTLFDLKFLGGQSFTDNNHDADGFGEYIVNESAMRQLQYDNANDIIGKSFQLKFVDNSIALPKGKIIGVVEDFHLSSLKNSIEPLVFFKQQNRWLLNYAVAYKPNLHKEAIADMQKVWTKLYPGYPLTYQDLGSLYKQVYKAELQQASLLSLFTGIALFICVMGLLGLVLLSTNKRTKEIGVRKVNGASVSEILMLFNKDFIKWIFWGYLFACPIAWYIMSRWLSNFAYKTELSWWIFALAGILALSIALLTVSWQSWRAATRNPVEALRYE